MRVTTHIYFLTNVSQGKYLGDKNQAIGIKNALTQLLQKNNTKSEHKIDENEIVVLAEEFDVNNLNELEIKICKDMKSDENVIHKQIIIGIGDHGLKVLPALKQKFQGNKDILVTWASHQPVKGFENFLDELDIVALPQHVFVTTDEKVFLGHKAKLVKTIGVAHNVTTDVLKKEFSDWGKNEKNQEVALKIANSKNLMGVFLGGDAPDSFGQMHKFTQEDAQKFAKILAPQAKRDDFYVLVTNGPRTSPDSTKSFVDVLKQENIKYYFEQFIAGKSAYLPFLGALLEKQIAINVKKLEDEIGEVGVFVTGDSTSMVAEILDNFDSDHVYIMQIDSMNKNHESHMDACVYSGLANKITADGEIIGQGYENIGIKSDLSNSKAEELKIDSNIGNNSATQNKNAVQLSSDAINIAK